MAFWNRIFSTSSSSTQPPPNAYQVREQARDRAFESLKTRPTAEVVKAMEDVIKSASFGEMKWVFKAVEVLEGIGGDQILPALALALAKEGSSREKEWQSLKVIELLQRNGSPAAVDVLVRALEDHEESVALAASKALSSIGWKPTTTIDRVMWCYAGARWDKAAAKTLGPEAVDTLLAMLGVGAGRWTDAHRTFAFRALGEIGDRSSVDPLILELGHRKGFAEPRDVRAGEALARIGDRRAIPALCEWLDLDSADYRRTALSAIQMIDPAFDESRRQLKACPSCAKTQSRLGAGEGLHVFRCGCDRAYCDHCSGGGLVDLPRCPVSAQHEGMRQIGIVPPGGRG